MSIVTIYTDGSCIKNNQKDSEGPGGWGFVVLSNNIMFSDSGGEKCTTNNRMEMQAVIEALKHCDETHFNIVIYTDSMYVMNCAQRLWKRKANTDLWGVFDSLANDKNIKWEKVKAHSGDKWNDYVDNLANSETQKIKKCC